MFPFLGIIVWIHYSTLEGKLQENRIILLVRADMRDNVLEFVPQKEYKNIFGGML